MSFRYLSYLLLLLPLVNCQGLDRLFVATGDPNDESVKTEVIDLNDPSNVCNGLPDYPLTLDGASGGLVDDFGEKYPIVCGGYYYGEYFDTCVAVGKTEFKLVHARAYGAAVSLPGDILWIAGGKGGEFGGELSSTEIVEILDDPITTEGPELPVNIAYHCMTLVDDSTVMIIGGYIDGESFTEKTFYVNIESTPWTFSQGPSMKNYRGYLGCGSFNSELHGGTVTMAFGGWDGGRTIYDDSEILVKGETAWTEGTPLPQNMFQMATVTNPANNGLLVVGGHSKGIGEMSTLHEFTCPSSGCEWRVLDQRLQVPRSKHVAFLIDDSVFNCKHHATGNSTETIH